MGFLYDLVYGYKGKNNSVFDNARYMNAREEKEIFTSKNEGFSVDGTARYLRKNVGFRGVILCGVVGSGKSQLLITSLMRQKPEASIFLLDPSKEIRQRTEAHFRKYYNIKILDFDNPIENGSLQFNPLVWVKENMHKGGVDDFVELLIVCNRSDGNNEGSFWELSSKIPLKLLVTCLIHDNEDLEMNLESLEKLLNWFDVQQERLNAYVQKWLPVQYHEQYESFIGGTEIKVRKSIIATCKSYLSMMTSETMRYITNKDTLDLGSIRKGDKPTIVYVHVSENRMGKMKFLLSAVNSILYSYLMEMPQPTDRDVTVVLEEFFSYRIDSFERIAVTARKRRITTILVLQDFEQVHAVYGRQNGDVIISNMVTKIVFGGCGLKTSRFVEEHAGLTTVEHEGRMIEKPLLSALSVRQLPPYKAVLLSGSLPVKILNIRYWHQQRSLRRIAGK